MPRRLLHSLLAVWWLTWVLVIIPCHTRGAISLGCPECNNTQTVPLFFGTIEPACCAAKHKSSNPTAPQKSSTDCAICQLVATTPNTPPLPPLLLFLQFREILPPMTPCGSVHFEPLRPYQSRAPPIA
jgi:hypothetical protein